MSQMRDQYLELLNNMSKKALIRVLTRKVYRMRKSELLSAQWECLSEKATEMRTRSCALGKLHAFGAAEYTEHLDLWDRAEGVQQRADRIFKQMEAEWKKELPHG